MFWIGDALEHEPKRNVAEKLAVGDERGIALRSRGREEYRRTAASGKRVNAEDVAHRALGRRVAAD